MTSRAPQQRQDDGDEELVYTAKRFGNVEVRVRRRQFKGRQYADVRVYEAGTPTQKGITLRVDEIADMAGALDRVLTRIAEIEGGRR